MVLTPSKFQQHPEGSFPEKSAGTLWVASPSLWYLPKLLHQQVGHGCALSNEAWISALSEESILPLKCLPQPKIALETVLLSSARPVFLGVLFTPRESTPCYKLIHSLY